MTYARAALAGLVLLAAAGCNGGDPAGGRPSDEPSSSASPSATPSPTPTLAPPTIPPEAQEHSAQGAAAFVEYYNALLSHSMHSLDSAAINQLSTDTCGGCSAIAELIDETAAAGGTSGNPKYRTLVTASQLLAGQFVVTADLTNSEFRFKRDAKSAEGRVEATTVHYIYSLDWTGTAWNVSELRKQDVPK